MSSTLDRLRRLNSLRPTRGPSHHSQADTEPDRLHSRGVTDALGEQLVSEEGACTLSTHVYSLTELRGTHHLGAVLKQAPTALSRIFPSFRLDKISSFHDALFLDTETTGLGTGASVYAFMVGIGTFETWREAGATSDEDVTREQDDRSALSHPTHFVLRQFFMRNPAEELALLRQLAAELKRKQLLITFNGRSFDAPLLRSRFRYNRPFLPDTALDFGLLSEDAPHLDLLLPARRLWRRRLNSCRLAYLEEAILHYRRTEDDVPGYLIPQLYADYVRTGDSADMERVFYHNREDILSMVSLATQLAVAFDRSHASQQTDRAGRKPEAEHESNAALQGQDWLSLGATYERVQDWDLAEPAYRRALDSVANHADRSEVFFRLGRLQKRQGRWQEATETWQLWLTSVPGNNPVPYIELAKYYEWQVRDYEQAEMWTAWALHNLRQEESKFAWSRTIGELEHRLRRIRRKKEG